MKLLVEREIDQGTMVGGGFDAGKRSNTFSFGRVKRKYCFDCLVFFIDFLFRFVLFLLIRKDRYVVRY